MYNNICDKFQFLFLVRSFLLPVDDVLMITYSLGTDNGCWILFFSAVVVGIVSIDR